MAFQDILHKDLSLVQQSGLFDADWYLKTYPDVGQSSLEPLRHFLSYGTLFLRDPGPDFSCSFHRHLHGQAALAGGNALLHHLKNPNASGRGEEALHAAHELAVLGRTELALRLARHHVPVDLVATLASLEMVTALQGGDLAGWSAALNQYLASYGQSALRCDRSGDRAGAASDDVFAQFHPATPLPFVTDGPLISVLMPVFNAATTLGFAVNSILQQSWHNLELLVVDDNSHDDSWQLLQAMSARDPRIRLMHCNRNVGPYVAKTLALGAARGTYVTGQDSDDWAHPQRLEHHMAAHLAQTKRLPLSLGWGLRLGIDGAPTHISRARTELSQDGFVRRSPVSCLLETDFLRQRLGGWDSVRFGADSELLLRAEHHLGHKLQELPIISLLCRDAPGNLSNDITHGTRVKGGKLSTTRRDYIAGIRAWLQTQPPGAVAPMPLPHIPRYYPVPAIMTVPDADIHSVMAEQRWR